METSYLKASSRSSLCATLSPEYIKFIALPSKMSIEVQSCHSEEADVNKRQIKTI